MVVLLVASLCGLFVTATAYCAWDASGQLAFLVATSQLFFYGLLIVYARVSRGSVLASCLVLFNAGVLSVLSYFLLATLSGLGQYGTVIILFWILFAQLLMAVVEGYLSYMLVEQRRLRGQHVQGKLAVLGVLCSGVAALCVLFLASKLLAP